MNGANIKNKWQLKLLVVSCVFLLFSCRSSDHSLFEREFNKRPNVNSSSKAMMRSGRRGSVFSSKKRRYGYIVSGASGVKDKSANKSYGARKSKRGRKK